MNRRLLLQRILPAQIRETREVAVRGAQHEPMFDGERREMRVRYICLTWHRRENPQTTGSPKRLPLGGCERFADIIDVSDEATAKVDGLGSKRRGATTGHHAPQAFAQGLLMIDFMLCWPVLRSRLTIAATSLSRFNVVRFMRAYVFDALMSSKSHTRTARRTCTLTGTAAEPSTAV